MSGRAAAGAPPPDAAGARHRSREAALQMLYQAEVGRSPMGDVLQAWPLVAEEAGRLGGAAREFAHRLATGVSRRQAEIDPLISEAASSWRIERMTVIDRAILRLAVFEFLEERDTPAGVIIDEAIELARSFSSDESIAFVNGVLDAIRRRLERT